MNFQDYCDIADREIHLNVVDEKLMKQAKAEAKGISAVAHQNYWRLRATDIQQRVERVGNDGYAKDLIFSLDNEARKQARGTGRVSWLWALACFASLIGSLVFPRLLITAGMKGAFTFYACTSASIACLVLAIVSYSASKRLERSGRNY